MVDLEFMGEKWDAPHKATSFPKPGNLGGFADGNKPSFARQGNFGLKYQEWVTAWATALLPLLHPGALVFCFGGTRTWHRLAGGLEDAGFQMWDTLVWLHAQGFPKAQDLSKLIDKMNGDSRGASVGASSGPNNSHYEGERYAESRQTQFGVVQDQPQKPAAGSALSESWSGHKTCALKPAWEPVLCFRAPSQGRTYADLALEFGSGCLNVDGTRISHVTVDGGSLDKNPHLRGTINGGNGGNVIAHEEERRVVEVNQVGRYPANVALECTCEGTEVVDADDTGHFPRERKRGGLYTFGGEDGSSGETDGGERHVRGKAILHTDPDCPAAMLDEQSGEAQSGGFPTTRHGDKTTGIYGSFREQGLVVQRGRTFGSASRFFFTAKASTSERNNGLHGFESDAERLTPMAGRGQPGLRCRRCGKWKHSGSPCACAEPDFEQVEFARRENPNHHPTVKPLDLVAWLATLLLPPDSVKPRRLLVPFSGSGSEIMGALRAGWDEVVGVDSEPGYCEIARARVAADSLFNQEAAD